MRLMIPRPQQDETISSIVDRACSFYHAPRHLLLSELAPSVPWQSFEDLDSDPPRELMERLSVALDVPTSSLQALILTRPTWRLAPKARLAFCPKCWDEDVSQGIDTYFRNDWAWCFVTVCKEHGVPLERWKHISKRVGQRYLYREQMSEVLSNPSGVKRPYTQRQGAVDWGSSEVKAIMTFVKCHEAALRKRIGFCPTSTDNRLRWLYCLVIGDWYRGRFGAPLEARRPPLHYGSVLSYHPRYRRECYDESTAGAWEHFRSIADPDHRRTANWLVACLTTHQSSRELKESSGRSSQRMRTELLSGLHERYRDVFMWAIYPHGVPDSAESEQAVEIPASQAAAAAAWLSRVTQEFGMEGRG